MTKRGRLQRGQLTLEGRPSSKRKKTEAPHQCRYGTMKTSAPYNQQNTEDYSYEQPPNWREIMEYKQFNVWFANENYEPEYVRVNATSQGDALILAQAERIQDGLDYTLHKIEEV